MTFKDAKTELQELFQSLKSDLPKYIIEDIGKVNFYVQSITKIWYLNLQVHQKE